MADYLTRTYPNSGPGPEVKTYQDLVEHLRTYTSANLDMNTLDVRQAAQLAYNDFCNHTDWKYLWSVGRINLNTKQTSSTITVDVTGGAHERMVTIAAGTWPTWAPYGTLVINNVHYKVAERKSSTVITLVEGSCPTSDVAAGTSYKLYQESYPLPANFRKLVDIHPQEGDYALSYVSPNEWLGLRQRMPTSEGQPRYFTIFGSQDLHGQMAIAFHPYASTAETIDFVYQRSPRAIKFSGYETESRAGTITNTGTAVNGSGTSFNSRMAGSILRIRDSSNQPQGLGGIYPYIEQRVVLTYSSATALVLDQAPASNHSGVKYTISDPLDISDFMWPSLCREAEYQLCLLKYPDRLKNAVPLRSQAYKLAKERDEIYDPKPFLTGGPIYIDRWEGAIADA